MDRVQSMVIGAGPAGCAAAWQLALNGRDVLLVERLEQAGGLSRTIERHGARYDIGPHRFFTKSPRVMEFWSKTAGSRFQDVPRLTRILYRQRLLHYPLQPLNALLGLGPWPSVKAVASYLSTQLKRRLRPREPQSFEEWVTNQFGRVLYEAFFKTYTEKVWGIPCSEISAEWASQRIKGLSLPRAVLNAVTRGRTSTVKTLVDHFLYPRGGAGTAYEGACRRAEEQGAALWFGWEAVRLRHDGKDRIEAVELAGKDGARRLVRVDEVISTMPLTELVARMDPMPPVEVLAAAACLTYRTHLAVNLLVEGPAFPDNWVYVHAPEVRLGRAANYRNFCSEMAPAENQSPLTLEYFAFPGDDLERLTDAELVDLAIREGRLSGLLNERAPQDAFVVRSPMAYCVIRRGYETHRACLRAWVERFGNMRTAGRAAMFKYNNQDHSIMSALVAADSLLGRDGDPWAVNNEAEYHESGTAPDLCEEDRSEPTPTAAGV